METKEYKPTKPLKKGEYCPRFKELRTKDDIFLYHVQKEDLIMEAERATFDPLPPIPKYQPHQKEYKPRKLIGLLAQIFPC